IDIIDRTVSPMGSRLVKRWLALPLKNIEAINERLDAVEFFVNKHGQRDELISLIKEIGDIERLISKVAAFKVNPRELVHLKRSLAIIAEIKTKISSSENPSLKKIADQLNPCELMHERLQKEL